MTQFYLYRDAFGVSSSFSVPLGNDRIRLGELSSLEERAEHLDTGSTTLVFDDPNADMGSGGDAIRANARLNITETACPVGNQRLYSGIFGGRQYKRRAGQHDSLRLGVSREIEGELHDLNTLASMRVIPNSDRDAIRPAESVNTRLEWILSTGYMTLVVDAGLVVSNSTHMTKADYRGQRPANVVNDCELAAGFGWNAFIYWNEATAEPALFFDNANTSTAYSSTLRISNVLSDLDSFTDPAAVTFGPSVDAELSRNPSDLGSGVYLPFENGAVYRTSTSTIDAYGRKDIIAPNSNVKSRDRARAQADDFLVQHATEEERITVTVELPPSHVNLIRAGQRIQVRFQHLPGYESFTWCRVLTRAPGQTKDTDDRYFMHLELSPQEEGCTAMSIRQHSDTPYLNSTPGYVDLPAPVLAGSLILVRIEYDPTGPSADMLMDGGLASGYTRFAIVDISGDRDNGAAMFGIDAVGGEQHIERDLSVLAGSHMCVYEIVGATVADCEVVSATHQSSTGNPKTLSPHVAAEGLAFDLFIGIVNEPGFSLPNLNDWSGAPGTGWTEHYDGPITTAFAGVWAPPYILEGNAEATGATLTPSFSMVVPSGKTLSEWAGISVLVRGATCT